MDATSLASKGPFSIFERVLIHSHRIKTELIDMWTIVCEKNSKTNYNWSSQTNKRNEMKRTMNDGQDERLLLLIKITTNEIKFIFSSMDIVV